MAAPQPADQAHDTGFAVEPPLDISHIEQALAAIYSPQSSNDTRQAASSFLEDAKRHSQAPGYGYALASERANEPTLRHYGLSMLEYCIKYTWETYPEEKAAELRMSVVRLAFDASGDDLLYLRNKVAQLVVETAKRSWAVTWMDMDELLVKLWQHSPIHQHLVLSVLETLSDETFKREDPTIGAREHDIGNACVEIFTPAATLAELYPNRGKDLVLRHGEEGWLQRISDLLQQCMNESVATSEQAIATALKCITALRSSFGWTMFRAIAASNCISSLQLAALHGDLSIRTATVEAWLAIYSRSSFRDEDFIAVVGPMFASRNMELIRNLYSYSQVSLNDFDDSRYTLNKKLTELLNCLGSLLEQRLSMVTSDFDVQAFFPLLFDIMHSPSLMVSIPVLHLWTKFLRSRLLRETPFITNSIGGLLEICSSRLVRYENFPDDSDDPTYQFLSEDIDTLPERHAFLGNYRRYCNEVVEIIVRRMPVDAITHILEQAMKLLQAVAEEQQGFQPEMFSKNSAAALKIDAQSTVIDAAVKGYVKWLSGNGDDPQQNEQDRARLQALFEQCGSQIMVLDFRDPDLQRKVIQLLVVLATKPLHDQPSFASQLLDHLLETPTAPRPELQLYSEAVKSLHNAILQELSRLAMTFPDHFLTMFDELERRVSHLSATKVVDEKYEMGYQAFLFVIVHRSSGIDRSTQLNRLEQMLLPVRTAWQEPGFTQALESFGAFCELLGLSQLADFLVARQFHKEHDWSSRQLDEEGRAFQNEVASRCHNVPLRLTKALLAASTEKIEDGTPQWELSCELWASLIPIVLPNLLRLISYAQAFNNMQSWSFLPEEMQHVIQRMLTDRFWQAGISTESRDDFFARVSSSRSSYEGFASTVRGSVRQIRETGYWIVYGLIRFKDFFYGIPDLSEPLSHALFSNANALSAHHFSVLLNMSVQLIEGCPPKLRSQFLPAIVSQLFVQLDRKITGEWEVVKARSEQVITADNLGDEMKTESILRQLTFTAVSLAYTLLDHHRPDALAGKHKPAEDDTSTGAQIGDAPPMHTFIIGTESVLGPILMFLKNALRFRDARSVALVVRTLRNTLPSLPLKDLQKGSDVRHFLADDLLKTAITSLNETYFIDVQKDLASLIAHLLSVEPVEGEEDLARSVLLSLPGLGRRPDKVESVLSKLRHQLQQHGGAIGDRQLRALVLDLLKDVRGQSIQEMGRIVPSHGAAGSGKTKRERSKLQEQYMTIDEAPAAGGIGQGDEDSLAGVAGMFG